MLQKISGIIIGNHKIFKSLNGASYRNFRLTFKFIFQNIRQFFCLFENAISIIFFKTDNCDRTIFIGKCNSHISGIYHTHTDILYRHSTKFSVISAFRIHSLFQKNQTHLLFNVKPKILLKNIKLHLFIIFLMNQISHALFQTHLCHRSLRAP